MKLSKRHKIYMVIFVTALIAGAVFIMRPTEEKFLKCYVDEMRGQSEDMKNAVFEYCKVKTKYNG